MKYKVIRTETADVQIRKIILYIAENFGNAVALEKLDNIESGIRKVKKIGTKYFGFRG